MIKAADQLEDTCSNLTSNMSDLLLSHIAEAQKAVAPLWPLADTVAVNPFYTLAGQHFMTVRESMRAVRDTELLMPMEYYQQQYDQGAFSEAGIVTALAECQSSEPKRFADLTTADVMSALELGTGSGGPQRSVFTLAELAESNREDWPNVIVNEISKFCAAHFDAGQAAWTSPYADLSFFAAWKEFASADRRFELLGATGFRRFVASLPSDPVKAIEELSLRFGACSENATDLFMAQLFSVGGWAAYAQYVDAERSVEPGTESCLTGLLAIRLAYDVALADCGIVPASAFECVDQKHVSTPDSTLKEDCVRYVLQTALENSYRAELVAGLFQTSKCLSVPTTASGAAISPPRSDSQMVFCIDVRSEVVRRHIEAVGDNIETFGFAGFFGIPAQYAAIGDGVARPQLPVLLKPACQIEEVAKDAEAIASRKHQGQSRAAATKRFQTTLVSGFAFVESCGLLYINSLIREAISPLLVRLGISSGTTKLAGQQAGTSTCLTDLSGQLMTTDKQVELAAGILQNLGLKSNFARLVVFCGHASQSRNNPLAASLDCGACGGHSGESNARMAATLLNSIEVRQGLASRGLYIPDDTWFVGGLHNTTTDEISLLDKHLVPESHAVDIEALESQLAEASKLTRLERAGRFQNESLDRESLSARSVDWSEVRPEWGLAGNAAFIVAPRSRTKHLKMGGRVFLHSYDYRKDEHFSTLELILTAPMVVANWINMQYYSSVVDNKSYGSGNKALHNVVGKLGLLEGGGGDLRGGLPLQSIHDGQKFQHDPMRLQVFVEAPRSAINGVLAKHAHVDALVTNGWLHLNSIDEDSCFRYVGNGQWATAGGQESLEDASTPSIRRTTEHQLL